MNRAFRLIAVGVLTVALGGCQRSTTDAVHLTETTPAKTAAPRPNAGIQVLDLRGDGAAIGAAHGRELKDAIRLLHDRYLNRWFRNEQVKSLAQNVALVFESKLDEHLRAEIAALAQATGLDERDVMLANCFLDVSPMAACSTIALPAGGSADGVARFGRNLDFASFGVADKYSVLMVYHPTDKHAFAAVSWPGLIGVLSGMNEHGLSLANMEVSRSPRLPQALPYTLLYRTVLEECRTVDEAVALLQKSPRQTANNLMLMDAGGDRAVVEIRPESVTVRRAPSTQALISTNHQRGPTNLDAPGACARFDYLHDTAAGQFGAASEASVKQMLQHVGGVGTLQSMIFEPASRTLVLSTGASAAERPFQRIELGRYFSKR